MAGVTDPSRTRVWQLLGTALGAGEDQGLAGFGVKQLAQRLDLSIRTKRRKLKLYALRRLSTEPNATRTGWRMYS